jgi:hypothetical protein
LEFLLGVLEGLESLGGLVGAVGGDFFERGNPVLRLPEGEAVFIVKREGGIRGGLGRAKAFDLLENFGGLVAEKTGGGAAVREEGAHLDDLAEEVDVFAVFLLGGGLLLREAVEPGGSGGIKERLVVRGRRGRGLRGGRLGGERGGKDERQERGQGGFCEAGDWGCHGKESGYPTRSFPNEA